MSARDGYLEIYSMNANGPSHEADELLCLGHVASLVIAPGHSFTCLTEITLGNSLSPRNADSDMGWSI